MIEQPELTVDKLVAEIQKLDRDALVTMATKAREAAKLDADKVVADAIIALTK
jgi:UDP-N-acetylglucosamine--N-acetylmuramyl-(pentapeptide) pyrophosphoryl-undecaprenol N-acetylglucosamine transferase